MAEIQDSDFLRILRDSQVVTPEQVRSAQELQRSELDRQGSCRTLFNILQEKGLIDERIARSLKPPSEDVLPGDVTPHTPTVVLSAPEETPSDVRRVNVNAPSTITGMRAARKRPPEVEAVAADPRHQLGPYILIREVGKGGMGRVYRAWDETLGRIVALKVIDTEDVGDRERFVREAQIAGRLNHFSIATVFQAGEQGTRGYIAMQFIEGGPIDAQKLPPLTALSLIRDAAQALSYAHEQGVVHRDVKPGNLMVDGKGRVFLTDFGLAKEVVANAGTQLSITGTTFGTPQFMSPEQARGEHRKIDGRSDVYSLGATLYALLARRPPFTSTNLATLLLEVLDKKPPPVSRFNREISPELEMLVERSMAKDPGKRFPTMAAFAGALDVMIRDGRYAGRYGMAKSLARRWLPRIAGAAVVGAALWFGIPILLAPAKHPPGAAPVDPVPALQAAAMGALRTIEGQSLDPADLKKRIDEGVFRPVAEILQKKPGDLQARATRLRALYVKGDLDAVAKELSDLGRRSDEDYRLLWVSALLALERALAAPCPLPALEAPAFEWDEKPAPWPAALVSAIAALDRARVGADLAEEYRKDRPSIDGLVALTAAGATGKAADLLRQSGLPVLRAAWCRAAYLDRRFSAIREAPESKGLRERLGAKLALAVGSTQALQLLLEDAEDAAPAIHAALARMEESGSVETHVREALKGASPERRAALISARLRSLAPAGTDDEKAYKEAIELLGDKPATWPGRLAAIELRIGLGARKLRARADGRPELEEAVRRADDLAQKTPGWGPPRVLGILARLRLGRLDEARADLLKLDPEVRKGIRACLTASAVELAVSERERRAGRPYGEAAKKAQDEALGAPRDHVEGLLLLGSASLILAQHAAEVGNSETEFVSTAVESLTKASKQLPRSADARYNRARAMFLQAELRRRSGTDGKAEDLEALADVDAALAAAPDFHHARYLRGIVYFSLGRDAEAVADWRALIQADRSWNTPEIESWIQRAEKRQSKK